MRVTIYGNRLRRSLDQRLPGRSRPRPRRGLRRCRRGEAPRPQPARDQDLPAGLAMVKANHGAGCLHRLAKQPTRSRLSRSYLLRSARRLLKTAVPTRYVLAVAPRTGRHMSRAAVSVNNAKVPMDTFDQVHRTAGLTARGSAMAFDVASNPGLLEDGDGERRLRAPDRISMARAVLRRSTRSSGCTPRYIAITTASW